jgi:hypothetical protein
MAKLEHLEILKRRVWQRFVPLNAICRKVFTERALCNESLTACSIFIELSGT